MAETDDCLSNATAGAVSDDDDTRRLRLTDEFSPNVCSVFVRSRVSLNAAVPYIYLHSSSPFFFLLRYTSTFLHCRGRDSDSYSTRRRRIRAA